MRALIWGRLLIPKNTIRPCVWFVIEKEKAVTIFNTMDPKHMKMIAHKVQRGRYLFCPNGSHLAMYDDQKVYIEGVIKFIPDVDSDRF
jgi:hypothetical protein